MIGSIIEKIMDRYGFLGSIILVLAPSVLICGWVFVSIIYPVAFFTPVLIAIWMIWSVRGQNNE